MILLSVAGDVPHQMGGVLPRLPKMFLVVMNVGVPEEPTLVKECPPNRNQGSYMAHIP